MLCPKERSERSNFLGVRLANANCGMLTNDGKENTRMNERTARSPDQKQIEGGAHEPYVPIAVGRIYFFLYGLEMANLGINLPLVGNLEMEV